MTRPDRNAFLRQICAQGLETWRQTFAACAGTKIPHTEILRRYIVGHRIVFGVINGDLNDFYLIKGAADLEKCAFENRSISSEQAIRMAASLAVEEGHCGAIAFSRTGDPALGDFEDAVILKTVGEVDVALLSA
jgi:hypothetical protein